MKSQKWGRVGWDTDLVFIAHLFVARDRDMDISHKHIPASMYMEVRFVVIWHKQGI